MYIINDNLVLVWSLKSLAVTAHAYGKLIRSFIVSYSGMSSVTAVSLTILNKIQVNPLIWQIYTQRVRERGTYITDRDTIGSCTLYPNAALF